MPTSLIHLKIGYEYAQKNKQYDNKQFYLGLIAPDAVNLHGFAEKEKRWEAHKRAKDLKEWETNITNFYKENKDKYDNNYIYGYKIHVLTDIIFDEKNPIRLFPKIEQKVGKENCRTEYSKQMNLYECSELNSEWWKYVEEQLRNSRAETINNINKKDIEMWKKLILERYSIKQKSDYDLITPEYIDEVLQSLLLKVE